MNDQSFTTTQMQDQDKAVFENQQNQGFAQANANPQANPFGAAQSR